MKIVNASNGWDAASAFRDMTPVLEAGGETCCSPHRGGHRPVLVAVVDASEESLQAAQFALAAAAKSGAQLLLVHPVCLNLLPWSVVEFDRLKGDLCREASERLQPFMRAAQAKGVPVICLVQEGYTHAVVCQAARTWEAQLIIMASRRPGWLVRWLVRPPAVRIARASSVPVLNLQLAA